jgi:hypothetical protein
MRHRTAVNPTSMDERVLRSIHRVENRLVRYHAAALGIAKPLR